MKLGFKQYALKTVGNVATGIAIGSAIAVCMPAIMPTLPASIPIIVAAASYTMIACDIGPDLAFLVKEFSTVFLSKNPSDAKVRAYGFTISKVGLKLAGLLATSYGMRAIMKTGILQKAGVWLKGTHKNLSGRWIDVNESMSDASRAYQKQITGKEGQAFLQNGVKFDGMNNGTLIEAKGSYNNFINKNTGEFYDWFSGKDSLIDQARRQIVASNGAPINWYFSDQASMNAIKSLLQSQGIKGINFIYELLK